MPLPINDAGRAPASTTSMRRSPGNAWAQGNREKALQLYPRRLGRLGEAGRDEDGRGTRFRTGPTWPA